jgi:hypothetical protein
MTETANDTILVSTALAPSARTRRGAGGITELKVEELATSINRFLSQMEAALAHTPQFVGDFQFDEFEIYADISAKGQLMLLGTGAEAGATGGLRFVFRKRPDQGAGN